MKSQIRGVLVSLSFLTASVTVTAAQEVQSSPNTVVVGPGNDLRCGLFCRQIRGPDVHRDILVSPKAIRVHCERKWGFGGG